ncbi:hypothetical protein CYMTET_29730 [Cymbomonas tetramitiformis]|uniref:ABC-2 type transporter transmembrane domain-containing protein n=1 Tax=Cymbomonas tetramitiformis TaxID=36881 RepID=A0AAE0FKT8_9CHLO|nr:hypothetical protein CYMTET_29730 [Cymbomonas tetramitiformis]
MGMRQIKLINGVTPPYDGGDMIALGEEHRAGMQNRLGSLAFMLLFMALLSLSSLPMWREERLLFLSERASGLYNTPAYFTAIVLFDLVPLRVIPPTFWAFISYPMIGLRSGALLLGPPCAL